MLEGLLRLKEYHQSVGMDPAWPFVEKLKDALEPVAKLTRKMQAVQYTVGDFSDDLSMCEAELEFMNLAPKSNKFALDLLQAVEQKGQQFMESGAIKAALFLDPRFHGARKTTDDSPAIEFILNVKGQLDKVKGNVQSNNANGENNPAPATTTPSTLHELYLARASREPEQPDTRGLVNRLNNVKNLKLPMTANLLDFWRYRAIEDPELGELARIILAIPISQVTVERAFSSLPLIISDKRTKLGSDIIDALVLVKLNDDYL